VLPYLILGIYRIISALQRDLGREWKFIQMTNPDAENKLGIDANIGKYIHKTWHDDRGLALSFY
jgi:hypothetical protein